MQIITRNYYDRLTIVIVLALGLILAPVMPRIASAAEGPAAADSSSVPPPAGTAGGAAAGVDVSGSSSGTAPAGKGALAPPPQTTQPTPAPAVKSAEQKEVPKGIGASAGTAGTPAAESGGGVSTGWKITAGVLGIGLLIGLAGGGGGGGGGTSPGH